MSAKSSDGLHFNYKKIADFYRPVIRIEVSLGKGKDGVPCEALVDSGADWCFLKAEIGELLGLDIESGEEIEYQGISGEKAKGYVHKVWISVQNHSILIPVIFTRAIPTGAHQVVGQIGFFQNFKVNFDYQKKSIVLRSKK